MDIIFEKYFNKVEKNITDKIYDIVQPCNNSVTIFVFEVLGGLSLLFSISTLIFVGFSCLWKIVLFYSVPIFIIYTMKKAESNKFQDKKIHQKFMILKKNQDTMNIVKKYMDFLQKDYNDYELRYFLINYDKPNIDETQERKMICFIESLEKNIQQKNQQIKNENEYKKDQEKYQEKLHQFIQEKDNEKELNFFK